MTSSLHTLDFNPHRPMQGQISEHVRRLIDSGSLAEKERLQSTQNLAKQWGVDIRTVHLALLPLVREGLLVRIPRVGTFVGPRRKKLSRVVIYMAGEQFDTADGSLPRAVMNQLQRCIKQEGIEPDIWIDSRDHQERDVAWPAMAQAVAERRIQAVIVPQLTTSLLAWIKKLHVPYSVIDDSSDEHGVCIDAKMFARRLVQCVHEQGCRSVGVITGMHVPEPWGNTRDELAFHQQLHLETDVRGLELRPQWIQTPDAREPLIRSMRYEMWGYEWFHKLWSMAPRPDGLIVTDNVMTQGVIKAMLELHVRVPEQLKVASVKLAHVDIFSPLPLEHVVIDEAQLARGLLTQVQRQFAGLACSSIHVDPQWMPRDRRGLTEAGHDVNLDLHANMAST
ncbi:MAG: substrate-binding domain-containing protein [Phycisphaeraceae bacterium]|nr:substrate-binding domain-containing protein [Phycisphaeraceae bacterium]